MEGDEDCLLLIWPTTVVHVIDQDSPFYHMSAKDFYRKHYEVIVCLEGIVEPTGMSIQARSSYLGDEILWGYRFCNVLHFSDGCYRIDYSAFNKVEKVETSVASARHQKDQQHHHQKDSQEASKGDSVNRHQPHQVQILEYPCLEKAKLPPNYIATCSSNTDQNDGRQSLSVPPMHRRMPWIAQICWWPMMASSSSLYPNPPFFLLRQCSLGSRSRVNSLSQSLLSFKIKLISRVVDTH